MNHSSGNDHSTVFGVHPVLSLLDSNAKRIKQIHILPSSPNRSLRKIAAIAKQSGILLKRSSKQQLDRIEPGQNHQGVIAIVDPVEYLSLQDLLELYPAKSNPIFVVLDQIEDPHNVGAIIRNTHALGAQAIIIGKHHSATISGTVAKTAAGSLEYCPVAKVTNIAQAIDILNKEGFFTIATLADAEKSLWDTDVKNCPVAIVIGSEGKGVRRLVKERCNIHVSIPMQAGAESLNASVASGVILYECLRQMHT